MKKLIIAALVVASTGALTAFTVKNDSSAKKHDTVSDKKELVTADAKQTPKHNTNAANDKKELVTAD